jgi:ABC-2 type transport system permease protein
MLGVSLGILLAKYLPWADAERWEAVNWTAHLKGILLFALPDTFFTAAILFAAAVVWRRDIASFVAAILLLAGRAMTCRFFRVRSGSTFEPCSTLLAVRAFARGHQVLDGGRQERSPSQLQWLASLEPSDLDRSRVRSFCSRLLPLQLRRETDENKALETDAQPQAITPAATAPPHAQLDGFAVGKVPGIIRNSFPRNGQEHGFVVLVMIAGMLCILALALEATQFQGNQTVQTFPVTYWVIELIRGALDLLLIVIITYFSGALVWKDRDERMDEIADATPTPEWVSYAARLATLIAMVMLIQAVALLAGIVVQAAHGYYRFQFGLYVHELLVRDVSWFVLHGDSGFLHSGPGAQQVRGIFRFHSLLFSK